jgi:hypothetical protein
MYGGIFAASPGEAYLAFTDDGTAAKPGNTRESREVLLQGT